MGRVGRSLHVIDILPRQRAVLAPGTDVEVDVAGIVQCGVGMAAVDEALDECVHFRDVAGGTGFISGPLDAEGFVGVLELLLVAVRQGPPLFGLAREGSASQSGPND